MVVDVVAAVVVVDDDCDDDRLFISFSSDYIRHQHSAFGHLTSETSYSLMHQITSGVSYLHANEIIHRALATENLSVCLKTKPPSLKVPFRLTVDCLSAVQYFRE